MGYPEPDRDESIILEAKNVKYKSISFDARLTSRRIILIDSKKNIIPPQEIFLAAIWKVEAGENAIRDHLLTLTVVNNAGEKDQIVLTFPRLSGAERKRECNDWAKKMQGLIQPSAVEADHADHGPESKPPEEPEAPARFAGDTAVRHPAKKKIETARPLNRIIEPGPVPVVPVETSSLPSGVFCSRCGNRIPSGSTFCNHCGTQVKNLPEPAALQKEMVPRVQIPVPPETQIPVPPHAGLAAEDQERPIEQIIHSIEPLIEDSVPRTQPTPLVKRRAPQIISEPVPSEPPAEPVPVDSPPVPVLPETPAEPSPPVIWPVLHTTDSPLAPVMEPVPELPESPPPVPPPAPVSKLPGNLAMAVIVIILLAFIAGLIIAANYSPEQRISGANVTPEMTTLVTSPPTPSPATVETMVMTITTNPVPTQVQVPLTDVWVRVIYPGTFTGLIGTPGDQTEVTDSGDRLYRIRTINGTVTASVRKNDGSADRIVVEVYKDGVVVRNSSTVTPRGIVEIQLDLKSLESSSTNTTPPV
jgi:hypothetical protein